MDEYFGQPIEYAPKETGFTRSWDEWHGKSKSWDEEELVQQPNIPYMEQVSPFERGFMTGLPGFIDKYVPGPVRTIFEAASPVVKPVLKALGVLDFMAEGLERATGMFAQWQYARETGTEEEFTQNLGAAWKAAHFGWNFAGIDLLANSFDQGTGTYRQTYDFHGAAELARARRLIIDGATIDDVEAAMSQDWGALWFRGQLVDTFGHIFLDPFNFVFPKILTKSHKFATSLAGAKSSEVVLEGLTSMVPKAEETLATAQKALDATTGLARVDAATVVTKAEAALDVLQDGIAYHAANLPRYWERKLMNLMGVVPPTFDDIAKAGSKSLFKPWTWFKKTPLSRAMEGMQKVTDNLNQAMMGAESIEDAVRMLEQAVEAISNPATRGMWVSVQGRSLQALVLQDEIKVKDLLESMTVAQKETELLHNIAAVLGKNVDDIVMDLSKEGGVADIFRKLQQLAPEEATTAVGAIQAMLADGTLTQSSVGNIWKMFGDGQLPYSLPTFKLHVAGKFADSHASLAIARFGETSRSMWTKATSTLKAMETLAFLRTNPGYFMRNFLNNEITLWARGVWGAWETTDMLKQWDRMGLMEPLRLRAGMGMADVDLAKKATGSVQMAIHDAERMMMQASLGEVGWLDKVGNTVNDFNLGKLDAGEWARRVESWASTRAYTVGMTQFMDTNWQAGKGFSHWNDYLAKYYPEMDPTVIGDAFSRSLYNAIRDCRSQGEIKELFFTNLNTTWPEVLEQTAKSMGVRVDFLNDFLGQDIIQGLRTDLIDVLRTGTKDDVGHVLWQSHQRIQHHLSQLTEGGLDPIAQQTLAMMRHTSPDEALVYLSGRMTDEYLAAHTAHMRRLDQQMRAIRGLPEGDPARAEAFRILDDDTVKFWARTNARQDARLKAIEQASQWGVRVDQGALDAHRAISSEWGDFHTARRGLWGEFRDGTRTYDETRAAIGDAYSVSSARVAERQLDIDRALISRIEAAQPELAPQVIAWRRTVADESRAYMDEVNDFYSSRLPMAETEDDIIALYEEFDQSRMVLLNRRLQAEREGMDSLVTGLPFGANHTLDPAVQFNYMRHLSKVDDERAALYAMDMLRTADDPTAIVQGLKVAFKDEGFVTMVPAAEILRSPGSSGLALIVHPTAPGETATIMLANELISGDVEALRAVAKIPEGPFDIVQELRNAVNHELAHYYQGIVKQPGRFTPAYSVAEEYVPALERVMGVHPDNPLTAPWSSLTPSGRREFAELMADDVATHLANPAKWAGTEYGQQLDDWLDRNPELFNAMSGRGKYLTARTPKPLPVAAISEQAPGMAAEILDLTKMHDGAIYSPYYMRNMRGADAWSVSIHPERVGAADVVQGDITAFIEKHADLLSDPRYCVATRLNPQTGNLDLSINVLVEDQTVALRLGRTYGQTDIYHLRDARRLKVTKQYKDLGQVDDQLLRATEHGVDLPMTVAGPPASGPGFGAAMYQRLVPDMMPNAASLDELWMSEGGAFISHLGRVAREQMDMPPLQISGLPADAQTALRGYVTNLGDELRGTVNAGMTHAQWLRDAALLNYSSRTHFDHAVGSVMPFSFWTTHSMWNWFWWSALEKPTILANYHRIRTFLTQYGTAQMPGRFQGSVPLGKLPFLPDWMGPVYVNPLKVGLPFDYWFDPVYRSQDNAMRVGRRTERNLNQLLQDGEITQAQLDDAMRNQSGDLWNTAMGQAQETMQGTDPVETMSYLLAPHAPLMWAYHAMKGQPENIGPFLPATRTIKGLSALLGYPGGGLNIEGWLREKMGLPKFDRWEDYRAERMLSNMTADGEITADDALRAMVEGEGNEHFDEAMTRQGKEAGISALGSAFGVPIRAYPPGEERARELQNALYKAYEREDAGEEGIVNAFYDQYPEVSARLALWDEPEDRLQRFLVDQVWDKYLGLDRLTKNMVREEFGENFRHYFLNEETRATDEVPIEILSVWLKLMGGDPPGTLAGDVLPLQQAPPEIAKQADTFYQMRDWYFPDWFDMQQEYFKLEEGSARKDYLKQYPQLKQYWRWREDFMLRNPNVTPYLTDNPPLYESIEELRAAEARPVQYTWWEWQMSMPPSLFRLVTDTIARGLPLDEPTANMLDELASGLGITLEELLGQLSTAYESR